MIAHEKMTAAQFEQVCEQLGPCELVRGEVVPLSPGGMNHSSISINIAGRLWSWAKKTGLGRVWTNEAGIIVDTDPDTVRGADVAYISYNRLPKGKPARGFARTPPELVVEVVGIGQGWQDMVEKTGEYLRMGVDRVWIVDPEDHSVHIFQKAAAPIRLSDNDTITDETILPGFACPVAEFFED